MQRFQVDRRRRPFGLTLLEDPGRAVKKLASPLRDLIDMHIELLAQISQCLFPFSAASATFALKAGL